VIPRQASPRSNGGKLEAERGIEFRISANMHHKVGRDPHRVKRALFSFSHKNQQKLTLKLVLKADWIRCPVLEYLNKLI